MIHLIKKSTKIEPKGNHKNVLRSLRKEGLFGLHLLTRPFGATCIVQPSGRPSWFKARLTWDWPEAEAPGPEAESRLDPESVSVMDSDLIEGAGDPVVSPPIDKSWVIWINEESFAEGLKLLRILKIQFLARKFKVLRV